MTLLETLEYFLTETAADMDGLSWEIREETNYEDNNIEGLYHFAQECGDYETLVDRLYNEYGVKETRDGVKFNSSKVNVVQINSEVFDF